MERCLLEKSEDIDPQAPIEGRESFLTVNSQALGDGKRCQEQFPVNHP